MSPVIEISFLFTYQHVGGCEGSDEVVARLSYRPVDDEGQQYEYVATDREDNADCEAQSYQDCLPELEGRYGD